MNVLKILSVMMIGIGLVLAVGKAVADSEPGAIPLLMVLLGAVGLVAARARALRA